MLFNPGGQQASQRYEPAPAYYGALPQTNSEYESSQQTAHPAVSPRFMKQEISYEGGETPGTVVINTRERLLYLVQENGRAVRYGIGVGRPGFTWAGTRQITQKREWPDWTPPPEMLKRRPDLPRHMAGGIDNPLGARAMYLGSTLYRIHGSNEPWTIGTAVSSGCIRMRNEDVIDLYSKVKVGTKVVVI
jgi:lipoprotein-anchoring transpeptidase ErfK/SrfK